MSNGSRAGKTRVVRIIDRLNIGGPAKHVVWLTANLSRSEFETVLVTGTVPHGEGDMSYFAHAAGVRPVVVAEMSRELGPRDVIVIGKLLRLLWKVKPQIIHTHKAKAGAVGRIAAFLYIWMTPSALWLRPRPCRVVHTYHGHVFHSYFGRLKTKFFVFVERFLAWSCSDRIITVSEQQRREIGHDFGVGRPDQFRVIPLGIDCDEIGQPECSLRRELAIGDEELLIGIVGRLCEVKNHLLFIEAAAKLSRQSSAGQRLRFLVIGDGHLRAELQAFTERLGVAESVVFVGFRKDAAALYGDLDLVALTSVNEGTPLTLIEAMGSGRAVVATEVGGVVDIMGERRGQQDGFTIWDHGLTVPSQDAGAFARALTYLLSDADLRRAMGQRGREFVLSRLSKERLIHDIEGLYRELTAAP